MILPQPLEVWHSVFLFCYAVYEVGGLLAQVVFGGGEDAFVLLTGMLGDEQSQTGCGDDADRTSAAIQEIARFTLLNDFKYSSTPLIAVSMDCSLAPFLRMSSAI